MQQIMVLSSASTSYESAMLAGVLAARAASTVTGRSSDDTGIRIESIIKAGLTGPMAEALAMYYQVRTRYGSQSQVY